MEFAFEIRGIAFEGSELTGLPGLFLCVEGRIEDVTMCVQMRIGQAVDRPRGEMDKLPPDHIARGPVLIAARFADARLHLGFHIGHRFADGVAKRIEQPVVLREGMQDGNAFRDMEIEVIADATLRLRPQRQLLAGAGMLVITESVPHG